MTMRYHTIRVDDAALRERMKAIAHKRLRFGYRRARSAAARGAPGQPQAVVPYLSRREAGCRRRGGRKRAMGTRAPMLIPMAPNQRWSLDFVSDQMTDCQRFRVLTEVDDCTRVCLALVADKSPVGTAGGARARGAHRHSWKTGNDRQRQRHRVHLERHPRLRRSQQDRLAFTSLRASPFRMPSSRASTGGCGMNCSTKRCSPRSRTSGQLSPPGEPTTTSTDPTRTTS